MRAPLASTELRPAILTELRPHLLLSLSKESSRDSGQLMRFRLADSSRGADESTAGEYRVEARNSHGTASSSATLTVKGKLTRFRLAHEIQVS